MQICLSEFIRILTARANNAPFLTCTMYVIRSTSLSYWQQLQECQNSGCYLMMKPISSFDVFRQWINLHTNGFRFQFFFCVRLHRTNHFLCVAIIHEWESEMIREWCSSMANFSLLQKTSPDTVRSCSVWRICRCLHLGNEIIHELVMSWSY